MRVYLASRYSRRWELAGYAEELRALGHTVTSRWLTEDVEGIEDDGVHLIGTPSALGWEARKDLVDIERADCLIAFTEEPGLHWSRGSRHVEMGIAIALEKRLVVIGPRETLFHHLPQVERFPDWPVFLAAVVEETPVPAGTAVAIA